MYNHNMPILNTFDVTRTTGIIAGGPGSGGKNKMRPLGSMRPTLSESMPRFPPLTTRPALDSNYVGIQGNAMSVPPPKEQTEPHEKIDVKRLSYTSSRKSSSSKSDSSASVKQDDGKDKKELKEAQAREKDLKQTVQSLQKTIDELKAEIAEKEKQLQELQGKYVEKCLQEEKYKELYEKEKESHEATRQELDAVKPQLAEKDQQIQELKDTHQKEVDDINQTMGQKISDLTVEKNKEIEVREEKLKKLKNQMADALKGNSWERQQQLDELTKELTRVQEEADSLRFKIKSVQKNGKQVTSCSNCDATTQQATQTQSLMAEKDKVIKDLKALCTKFEKQLAQQDEIIRMYGQNNGVEGTAFAK